MTQTISAKLFNVSGAAEGEGFVGTGTDPKTLAPLEFVVFKTDELVLQMQQIKMSVLFSLCGKKI